MERGCRNAAAPFGALIPYFFFSAFLSAFRVAYRLLFAILTLTGKHCILFFFIFDKSVLFPPRFFYAKFLPFSPYFHNLRHIARIFGKFFAIHNQKLSFP